jgi:ribose transport system substrate-binding protein
VAGAGTTGEAKKKPPLKEQMFAKNCGKKSIKIAFVSPLANTYGQAIEKGIRSYLKPCKNVKVVDFDTGFDSQKEFNTIEDITTQRTFQGITFLPLDGVGVIPAVKDAVKAGIKILNFNNPLGTDYVDAKPQVPGMAGTVIEPQYKRGVWMAQMSAQACKGIRNCKVGFIAGVIGISAELAIKAGFDKELAKHKNMHLTTYQGGGQYLPDPSHTVAQNMLQAHHDLNVITGSGDQMIRGAELAVADAGLQKQVKLVGLGGSQIAVASVKAGRWFGTVITQPLDQGRLSAKVVLDHIRNPKLKPQGINPFDYTHRSPLLTKASLAKTHFVAQWSG